MCSKMEFVFGICLFSLAKHAVSLSSLDLSAELTWNLQNWTISLNGSLSISSGSDLEDNTLEDSEETDPNIYIMHYYCLMKNTRHFTQRRLVRGRRSWSFPAQDTNLTLVYPASNKGGSGAPRDHVLTSYRVRLRQDSAQSRGRLVSGGVLREHIALALLSERATRLAYTFEVYSLPIDVITQEMKDSIECS